jgi:hypothetical protein
MLKRNQIIFTKITASKTTPYSLAFESIIIVTGPSFKSATFISAPNAPVWMGYPKSFSN